MSKQNVELAAFIGLDWADQTHVVTLQEAGGDRRRENFTLDQTPEALQTWIHQLRIRFGGRPVAIAVEQVRGALIYALMHVEFLHIYPVNPQTLAKMRQAFYPSGAKDDPRDADLLLEVLLAMRQQDLQEQIGVAGIILGSAGIKRLAHLGQCLRIDRIDVKKLHMHQGIDQSSAYLLDGNSHGSATEANAQLMNPGLQRLGSLVQRKVFPSAIPPSLLQRDHVRLIGPIQSYKCGEFDILFRHQWITPLFPRLRTLPAGSAHNPYSGVLEGHHLSICPAPRADRVRKSPSTVDTVGWLIRNPTRPVFPEGNSLPKEKEPKR